MQTIQINFWAKILTFETCSGDSIGVTSIIWRYMREKEFARFFPIIELCVSARGLAQISGVCFLIPACIYECLCCVNDIWWIDLLSEQALHLKPWPTHIQLCFAQSLLKVCIPKLHAIFGISLAAILAWICIWFAWPVRWWIWIPTPRAVSYSPHRALIPDEFDRLIHVDVLTQSLHKYFLSNWRHQ